MRPPVRQLRAALRLVPALLGVGAMVALLSGAYGDLQVVGPWQVALLVALSLATGVLHYRRLRSPPRTSRWSWLADLEIGTLLVVAGYVIVQPLGGLDSPAYPLLYLLLAFLAIALPIPAVAGVTLLAIAIDAGRFAVEGVLRDRGLEFAAHAGFLVAFSCLARAVLFTRNLEGWLAGKLQVIERRQQMEERARQYRLGLHAGGEEEEEGTWITAAVKEVEEAVSNALEVAEVALRSHTVAVFLLSTDDRRLVLHDCRSLADDVRRDPFDAGEGILAAVLKRRLPLRLCGDLKGISWYAGRPPVQSILAVPLIERRGTGNSEDGYVRGVLVADRKEAVPFTDDDERLLLATSREVLRAIEIERVMGFIRRSHDEKEQFFQAIQELNRRSSLDDVLATTLRLAGEVRPLDLVAFTSCSTDEAGRVVHRIEKVGGLQQFSALEGHRFLDNGGLVANAIRHATVLPAREIKSGERPLLFDENTVVKGLASLRIVPMRAGGNAIGSLVCASRRRRIFDPDAVRSLQVIALQAGEAFLRAQLYAQAERMATTDGLTGLLNHRTFQTRFDDELARATRSGRKVTLLLTDIDHFKSINDTYGHAAGDAVLRKVASILESCARSTDVVARYGGEEFAVVLPETDAQGGKIIAERIREAVQGHRFETDLGPLQCTISIGIATWPDAATAKQDLFEKADQCLYHCKRMGRNRSTTWEEMRRDESEVDAA